MIHSVYMLTSRDIEDFGRQKLKEILASGEPFTVVAGFVDYFGDGISCNCGVCGKKVLVRPWLYEAIRQHGLKVKCKDCVPKPSLMEQIASDLKEMAGKVKS